MESQVAVPDCAPAPVRPFPWVSIAWYGSLLLVLFAPVVITMVKEWATDESMGHGFFVPFVAGYIVWQHRDKILNTPVRPHWSGYVLIVLGFTSLIVGILGAEFSVQRAGFMFTLWGILLATCGWPMMKVLAFPLIILLFMIRIPLFIYSHITFHCSCLPAESPN
jgi:exosortase